MALTRVRPRNSIKLTPKLRMQVDTLENLMTGLGGVGDKAQGMFYANVEMPPDQLALAYRNDWIARKVVNIPAQDATRKWRDWAADKDDITELSDTEKALGMQRKTMLALQKARLWGGSAMIMGINQGKPQDEVDLDKIRQDDLQFVHVVSRYELNAGPIIDDLTSPYYGEPEYYDRSSTVGSARFHPSRIIRFVGEEKPSTTMQTDPWGDPVLQICKDAIIACTSVAQSIVHLVQDAKIDVVKIPDLTAMISDRDYELRLKKRFGLASDAKSIFNMLLLDKEEEWDRVEMNFSGLTDLVRMYLLMASGAADIPATRLLGQSPAGLNATGDSDTRNYYDRVQTEQTTVVSPSLDRLDEVMIRSSLGARPDEIFYTWAPLWQMDEVQTATVNYQKAQTFKIDVDSGVLDGAVLKEARENQLIEDQVYPGIETTIDELGEEYQEPEPMLMAPGATDPNADPNGVVPPANENNDPTKTANAVAKQNDRVRMLDATRRRVARVRPVAGRGMKAMYRVRPQDRRMIKDAVPKSLYVYRPVTNWKDLAAWAKSNGFDTTLGEDMHVTIAYSEQPVDWMKAGTAWGQDDKGVMRLPPGGVRLVEKLQDAVALLFSSSELSWRWCDIKDRTGADWKWPDYQPHITISYTGGPADISKVKPYAGELVLGPEVFQEVNHDYEGALVEDTLAIRLWGINKPKLKRIRAK